MTFCSGHGKGDYSHSSTLKLFLLLLTVPPFPKSHTLCIHVPTPSERTHTPMGIHTCKHIFTHVHTHMCSHMLKHAVTCLDSWKMCTSAHRHHPTPLHTPVQTHEHVFSSGVPIMAASARSPELRVIGHSQDEDCTLSGKPGPHGDPAAGCHGYRSACTLPLRGTCL